MRHGTWRTPDRGAAAVEFAIILPLLLVLIAGIVDFGRVFYVNTLASNAAREGVRMVALGFHADAPTRARAAAPGVEPGFGTLVTPSVGACTSGGVASYTVSVTGFGWVFLDAFIPLAAPSISRTATMRCGG